MISVGNDIIALQSTNFERTNQQRFYSKILCKSEFELYHHHFISALSFEKFVWLAWSVKESVYKFQKRFNPENSFSPTKINIQKFYTPVQQNLSNNCCEHESVSFNEESFYNCESSFNGFNFYTRSVINDELIFTVANNATCFNNFYWGFKKINDSSYALQSKAVRDFSLKKLNEFFSGENLSIEKSETGYPILKQQKNIPISFSHHGNFIGYAFNKSI